MTRCFLSSLSLATYRILVLLCLCASGVLCGPLAAQENAVPLAIQAEPNQETANQSPNQLPANSSNPIAPRLRLKSGDFLDGELVALDSTDSLGWKSPHFNEPLDIPLENIRGFELGQRPESNTTLAPWNLELHSGDRVTGELLNWQDGSISFKSTTFGELKIPTAAMSRLIRNSTDIEWLFQGPRDPSAWKAFSGDEAWTMQGGSLVSGQIGARTIGLVKLPEKGAIDLRLSWEGKAGFVLALGVDESASNINSSFRIETWQNQLVLVRQAKGKAEILELETLDTNQSVLELSLYFDQNAERVVVYSGYGKLLADLTLATGEPKPQPAIVIANHTESLRLDRLRVREWTMPLPADRKAGENYIVKNSLEPITAEVVAANSGDGWKLKSSEGEINLAWQELTEVIQIAASPAVQPSPESESAEPNNATTPTRKSEDFSDLFESLKEGENVLQNAEKEKKVESADKENGAKIPDVGMQLEFFDGARWRGEWKQCSNNVVTFLPASLNMPIEFNLQSLMSLRNSSASLSSNSSSVNGRKGAFMASDVQLEGVLVGGQTENAVLFWHALLAKQPVGINVTKDARLDFRGRARRLQAINDSKTALPGQVQVFGMSEEQKPTEPPFALRQLLVPSITLRNGDAFAAQLQSVNEEGIVFKSDKVETDSLINNSVQSIELRKLRSSKIPAAKKVERLLTVPRSSKNDPPTHVLISIEGDFLRGRLVAIDAEFATMEIRLEQVKVPLEKVAQIVWLHERSWQPGQKQDTQSDQPSTTESANNPNPSLAALPPGSVVAMFRNGLRMSLKPAAVLDQSLIGDNPLLGKCNLSITEIDLILLGPEANVQAADLANNPWKLTLAKFPLEPTEEEGGSSAGEQSTLVGQPAPEIELETVSGDKFKLSDLKGKVVVLDFWASWCGPCMQTMPEVDRIIAEFPAEQVELIAVNLEEPADRAKAAMERLQLHTKVVLDIDGVAAQRYQANAIPQTVIIDRDGNVLNVFVGGGQQFLKNFREALDTAIKNTPDSP